MRAARRMGQARAGAQGPTVAATVRRRQPCAGGNLAAAAAAAAAGQLKAAAAAYETLLQQFPGYIDCYLRLAG